MKKFLNSLLVLVIVFAVIFVLAKDLILKTAIEQSITRLTGFNTTIASLHYSFPSTIHIKGLEVQNPPGFQDKTFVNIPEIYGALKLGELLQSKKIHLPEVRLNIQEVHIEKNAKGVSNVEMLSSVGGQATAPKPVVSIPPADEKRLPFQLDRLELTIRNVSYEDRSGIIGAAPIPGKRIAVDVNVQKEIFNNITNAKTLVNLILVKVLNSATLGRILNIDPKQLLGDNVGKALSSGQTILTTQAAAVTTQVSGIANKAVTQVNDSEVAKKASALVGSTAGKAENILGATAGAAKTQVSGLLGKLKTLESGTANKSTEQTQ